MTTLRCGTLGTPIPPLNIFSPDFLTPFIPSSDPVSLGPLVSCRYHPFEFFVRFSAPVQAV